LRPSRVVLTSEEADLEAGEGTFHAVGPLWVRLVPASNNMIAPTVLAAVDDLWLACQSDRGSHV
jgi:hypothetical protein